MLEIDNVLSETLVPFELHIRGEVEPGRAQELVEAVTNICVNTNVEIVLNNGEPKPTIVTREDFMEAWNPQGGGNAWQKLVAVSAENEDFPLRIRNEANTRRMIRSTFAVGSIEKAIEWLRFNPQSGQGSQKLPKVLELLLEAETSA